MELRARIPAPLRRAGLMAALPALLVPAVAGTTPAQAKTHAPIVKRISPKNVFVGETLTIRGRYFRRGLNKNTVAFKRTGAKAVFVKAEKGTTKMLRVTLPKRLEKVLVVKNGTPTATRLKVRVLSYKFGKRFTSSSKSPVVGPEKPPAPPKPATVDPNADCDADGIPNKNDADDDNDLLPDTLEKSISKLLDTCKADTDGDGIEDGYEYQSAKDLNDDEYQNANAPTPYPRKMPFPNPLDGTDGGTDHDGDTLSLKQEYDLWKYTIAHGSPRTLTPLTYSAGKQYSLGRLSRVGYNKHAQFMSWANSHGYGNVLLANLGNTGIDNPEPDWLNATWTPYNLLDFDRDGSTVAEQYYYDYDGNGYLDDAERDEDADGLDNQWEASGCMTRGYWNALYKDETPYYLGVTQYGTLSLVDEDSDGDGVLDGADDLDHDDVPNVMECSRTMASDIAKDNPADTSSPPANRPWKGWVNPFNPCLPHPGSRTCKTYVGVGNGDKAWAPFNPDEADKYYYIYN